MSNTKTLPHAGDLYALQSQSNAALEPEQHSIVKTRRTLMSSVSPACQLV